MSNHRQKALLGCLAAGISLSMFSPALAADGAQKSRSEMDPKYLWKLQDIYPTNAAWKNDLHAAKQEGQNLIGYEGHLLDSPQKLLSFLTSYENTTVKLAKVYEYAHRVVDQDTTVSESDALVGQAQSLLDEFNSKTAFFYPEISQMSEAKLNEFMAKEPKLVAYRQYLSNILRQAKHTLPKEQEALLAKAGSIFGGPSEVFGKLNNADIKFPVIKDENGNKVELTKGNYTMFRESANREVRKNAYEGMMTSYQKVQNTLAASLNNQVKIHAFNRSIRNYPSSLEAALDSENIPVKVYTTLIDSVHEGLPSLHRYYALRQKILKLPQIHTYDMSVALVPDSKMSFTYEQSKDILNKALAPLGPKYMGILNNGLNSGWVDVYENKGKRSGAYSASIFGVHPFVLHNYTDNYWGMSTLAHEMGHAVNGYLSQTTNSYFNADNPIFVAEVASQTNELLLMDYMLKNTTDKKQKLYLLCEFANGIIGSIYRQTQLAEFEKIVHEQGDKGETLTTQFLNDTWRKLCQKYFGPNVVIDPVHEVEWARVPHMYYNFYVYKYSTSYAASMAIEDRILKQGTPAVDSYMRFLSAGCSEYPADLLKNAGVDLTTPQPFRTALAKFDRVVTEIEKTYNEIQAAK